MFFVLSGYLITTRLLSEEKTDLRRFYVRRFFRLMPCVWVYLCVLSVVALPLNMPLLLKRDLLGCLFFYRNYIPEGLITASQVISGRFRWRSSFTFSGRVFSPSWEDDGRSGSPSSGRAAWANTLFGELVATLVEKHPALLNASH